MFRKLIFVAVALLIGATGAFPQSGEWATQYVTLDDGTFGTGYNTPSVALVGQNDFVALVNRVVSESDIFGPSVSNYLVGYMDADSTSGRVADQPYQPQDQIEVWASGLDQVLFSGAWQIAGGANNYAYVANNDELHNILVFELTPTGVVSTDFRMETGTENIFAIDVSSSGTVYVVDHEGTSGKTDEVKIFAGIDVSGTTWGQFGGHNDTPIATIDLPPGTYRGVAANSDGSAVFVSSSSAKKIFKFVGDPVNGYAEDTNFSAEISMEDIYVDEDGLDVGVPTFLGLAYLDSPPILFAAVDSFLCRGTALETGCAGYTTGRIFVMDPQTGVSGDTIDIAMWNFDNNGSFTDASNKGRTGGFTSVMDVDLDPNEPAVYTQTFYGWAVEKWLFDGDLGTIVSVEPIPDVRPEAFALNQNYPNPFNPSTTIEFQVEQTGLVTLTVFNMLGQKVTTLVNENLNAGAYKVTFDASHLPSGIFFYSLDSGTFRETRKMVFLK